MQNKRKQGDQSDGEDEDEDKAVPGAYNPMDYVNLQVSSEVKDLFEYISRFKP